MTADRRVAGHRPGRRPLVAGSGATSCAEPIDGRPLLDHAIEAVAAAWRPRSSWSPRRDAAPPVPAGVRVVHDARPFEGPLAGVAAGLAATDRGHRASSSAATCPRLVPAVLERLVAALDAPRPDAAVLEARR